MEGQRGQRGKKREGGFGVRGEAHLTLQASPRSFVLAFTDCTKMESIKDSLVLARTIIKETANVPAASGPRPQQRGTVSKLVSFFELGPASWHQGLPLAGHRQG